ncbi:MAG: nitroreductase, partial [Planctomycetota bacterium]|nr:nitroreductase [Planctomycetota bacterium]
MSQPHSNIGAEFLRCTRYDFLSAAGAQRGDPEPPLTTLIGAPEARRIPLPPAQRPAPCSDDFWTLVNQRTSVREYTAEALSLSEISYLLWCCQGVKKTLASCATLRTVPSAGARHALETILLANRVTDLPPGLYQYLSLIHI